MESVKVSCVGLVLVGILGSQAARGAADATAEYLMKEPVTMMDVGLLQLNMSLDQIFREDMAPYVTVASYSRGENQIVIDILGLTELNPQSAAVAECKRVIGKVRSVLGPSTQQAVLKKSLASSGFAHAGFSKAHEPMSLASDIDRMIRLKVVVFGKSAVVHCEAPMLGTEIMVTQ
jgi:hypothetical protein